MKKASFDAICKALNTERVPFLVVGGVAVVHYGYGRLTQDVDLVIRLQADTIRRAYEALASLGYLPAVPVTPEQLADPAQRETLQREKNMKVLKFWSEAHPETPIDLFIDEPFDFEKEVAESEIQTTAAGGEVRIVSLETLLRMKADSRRPLDLADIDELNLIHKRPSSYDE
jgi:predicted nucleotidyltransferase